MYGIILTVNFERESAKVREGWKKYRVFEDAYI